MLNELLGKIIPFHRAQKVLLFDCIQWFVDLLAVLKSVYIDNLYFIFQQIENLQTSISKLGINSLTAFT